jgi:hypothetical protein
MKNKKTIIDSRPKIKIQIDNKTTITVRTMEAYKSWKEKYPDALIVE